MAIEVIDKIKQKNSGTFKLMDAVDVECSDGKDLETKLGEISAGGGGVEEVTEAEIDKLFE